MAKLSADQPLVPSVLDRLFDDDPTVTREPPRGRTQVVRELKQAVRRDLEDMLNARPFARLLPPDLAELPHSLVAYGVPDVAGQNFASPEGRERFRELLESTIARWEPRFQSVRVTLMDPDGPTDRAVHFRIDALLRADPAPEPVVFDSALEPATGGVEVRGVN
jgi:type VI secretion system protein ImpF